MHQTRQENSVTPKQLSFRLAGEAYALDILSVREICSWRPVTRLPQMPPHMLGALNLRGSVVPVLDLRLRFGLAAAARDANTAMIVVAVAERLYAIVVDAVSDVLDIDTTSVQPVPALGNPRQASCLKGLVSHAESMLMLLDVDALLRHDSLNVPTTGARVVALAA